MQVVFFISLKGQDFADIAQGYANGLQRWKLLAGLTFRVYALPP